MVAIASAVQLIMPDLQTAPPSFFCPIGLEVMTDPVVDVEGKWTRSKGEGNETPPFLHFPRLAHPPALTSASACTRAHADAVQHTHVRKHAPISRIADTLMRSLSPALSPSGHSYERINMEQWLQEQDTSPCTGLYLHSKRLLSNHALRNAIHEWRTGQQHSNNSSGGHSAAAHPTGRLSFAGAAVTTFMRGLGSAAVPAAGAAQANARNRWSVVERQYRRTIDDNPEDVATRCKLGALLRYHGESDGAVAQFNLALKSDPTHLASLFNLGSLLLNVKGDVDGAEDMYTKALDGAPNDVATLCNLAVLYQTHRKNVGKAEELLRRALTAERDNVPTLFNLANLLLDDCLGLPAAASVAREIQTKQIEAETCLRRALNADPHDAPSLLLLGKLVAEKVRGNTAGSSDCDESNAIRAHLDEAELLLRRAVTADNGTTAESLVALADFFWHYRSDAQRAEDLFVQSIACDATSLDAYIWLAASCVCCRTPKTRLCMSLFVTVLVAGVAWCVQTSE